MGHVAAEDLLIGAHTSASGGVHNALLMGQEIGATTIQLFTSSQKRWQGKPITEEEISLWEKSLATTGIKKVMSHDSYLINLGSPDVAILSQSQKAFKEELNRCLQLKLSFLNFHPGAATTDSEEKCLDQITKSLLALERALEKGDLRLLIETTAGQGTSVGHRFEHLSYIIEKVKHIIPIGVCIDTCHIFAAGYDIRNKEGWEATLKEFDRVVGLGNLYTFHVNDSLHDLGSRKDRHASLGEGKIGLECFKVMMAHPKLREIPKYLETPLGEQRWKKEIALLRTFAR